MNYKRKRGSTGNFTIQVPSAKYDYSQVHDPVLENPLDDEFEGLISLVGERRYLKALVDRFKVEMSVSPDHLTDHECRKVIRLMMRHASDYSGPEMKQ